MDLLTYSDISAALVGAGWSEVFGGNMQMTAIKSLVVSIVARVLSKNVSLSTTLPTVTEDTKNQLVVGLSNALYAYIKKQSISKAILSGMSIDLIGAEILSMMKLQDTVLFSTAATKP
jgi:hypothetical protein